MSFSKKNILIFSTTIIVLIYLLFVAFYRNNNSTDTNTAVKPNNATKNISNPLDAVPILSQYELDRLNKEIRRIIKLNNTTRNIDNYQIVIRHNSLKQTYDDKEFVYTTDFIVDSPDLKQSYRVHDEYYMIPHRYSNDYALLVTCPHPEDLIYPSFKCTDRIRQEGGTE